MASIPSTRTSSPISSRWDPPLYSNDYSFAVSTGNPALLARLNEGLAIIKQSGKYDQIYQKWFGVYEERSFNSELVRLLLTILIPVAVLFGLVFVWSWSLKRQVAIKTAELRKENELGKERLAALRTSEERFREIFDNSNDAIYLVASPRDGPTGKFIAVNRRAVEMLGYSEREFMDMTPGDIHDPETLTDVRNVQGELSDKGYVISQTNHRAKDGRTIPVELSIHGFTLGTERVNLVIARDITERKRADETLKRSERQLADIFDFLPDATFVIDRNGIVIAWNRAMEEMTGVPAEQMLGKGDYDYAIPFYGQRRPILIDLALMPDEEIEKNYYHIIQKEGDLLIAETDLSRPMGKIVHLWGKATPLYDEKGNKIGAIESIRDVTERKNAEEEREKIRLWQAGVNRILESVLAPVPPDQKLKIITDGVVETFGADFCRIWLIGRGDLCNTGCMHAKIDEGPHVCRYRDRCLHLKASSGRYTHIDGKGHRRVPFGAYKIGRIASGDETKFLTNDVEHDPRVHDHAWAGSLGLVSFAGYRLKPPDGDVLGVFALFARFPISPDMDAILEGLSRAISLAIQKDIADKALRKSEEQFRNVVETQTEFISRFRPDGTHLFVNEAYCRYFKKKCSELIGKKFRPEIPPEDHVKVREHFVSLTHDHPVSTIDHRIVMPDGTTRWQRWVDRAIFDEQGTLFEYQTVGRDITDLKQAEAALRDSENKLKDIVRGSPIPQFVIDRDHRVIQWNEALEACSGISAKDMLGTNQQWRAFYLQERPCMADLLVEGQTEQIPVWYSGKYKKTELIRDAYEATDFFSHIGPSGTWLHFTAAPIRNSSGTVIGAVETLEDVTEQKRAEEDLRRLYTELEHRVAERTVDLKRAQDAFQLANEKLNLLNSITRHDILNQLMALSGFLELSRMKTSDDTAAEYIQKAQHAAMTIERHISFTKLYQDIGVKSPVWQNVRECVEKPVADLLPASVTCTTDLDEIEIYADPLCEKVLYTLIDNTLRHGERVTQIRLSYRMSDTGELILQYTDNGIGIRDEYKERIFDRGFGKNTGFGLFLAREILAITGITIRETGEPGKGARFEMMVPKGAYRFEYVK